jgi:hypothetical protein
VIRRVGRNKKPARDAGFRSARAIIRFESRPVRKLSGSKAAAVQCALHTRDVAITAPRSQHRNADAMIPHPQKIKTSSAMTMRAKRP